MISVLVLTDGDARRLAATLSVLVSGVVEGVVADAVILVRSDDPDIALVAEASGAALVRVAADADPWRAGAEAARCDWLLCLRDGDVPLEGWTRAVERFLMAEAAERPVGRFRRQGGPLRERATGLIERFTGARPRAGDLVHRAALAAPPRGRRLVALDGVVMRAAAKA